MQHLLSGIQQLILLSLSFSLSSVLSHVCTEAVLRTACATKIQNIQKIKQETSSNHSATANKYDKSKQFNKISFSPFFLFSSVTVNIKDKYLGFQYIIHLLFLLLI